jgi:hypothetical protein
VLSDGDTGLRAIQREVAPNSTHILDWFHLAMRFQHVIQVARGLSQQQIPAPAKFWLTSRVGAGRHHAHSLRRQAGKVAYPPSTRPINHGVGRTPPNVRLWNFLMILLTAMDTRERIVVVEPWGAAACPNMRSILRIFALAFRTFSTTPGSDPIMLGRAMLIAFTANLAIERPYLLPVRSAGNSLPVGSSDS